MKTEKVTLTELQELREAAKNNREYFALCIAIDALVFGFDSSLIRSDMKKFEEAE